MYKKYEVSAAVISGLRAGKIDKRISDFNNIPLGEGFRSTVYVQ